jgi:hypothetical protein
MTWARPSKPSKIEEPVIAENVLTVQPHFAPAIERPIVPIPRAIPSKPETAPEPRTLRLAEIAPEPRAAMNIAFRRLDTLPAEELERRLLAAKEVSLDTESTRKESKVLKALAQEKSQMHQPYVGPLALGQTRPDLAGLPYCIGRDVTIPRSQAETMETLANRLRDAMTASKPEKDQPPDIDRLYQSLNSVTPKARQWANRQAVPCIRQMLQAENAEMRRMSCTMLGDLDGPGATAALVQWAVFDTDAANRSDAIRALIGRDRTVVTEQLAKYLRYPWLPAVQHACEAIVALDGTKAIPALLAAKALPDPDAPYEVRLPDRAGGVFRQELVRVNHARNCLLCHAPSQVSKEPLQAAIPDPERELPSPGSRAYYSGSELIAASTTYLRQDFSAMQPVESPGLWPARQRYDYFVAVHRELRAPAVTRPRNDSPYQRAYDFALQGLSAAIPDVTPSSTEIRLAETARFVALQMHPEALHSLKSGKSLLTQTPSELETTTFALQHKCGIKANRSALVAYFAEATESGPETQREKAARLLAVARDATQGDDLPAKLRRAAAK